jgi:hypothetical protein
MTKITLYEPDEMSKVNFGHVKRGVFIILNLIKHAGDLNVISHNSLLRDIPEHINCNKLEIIYRNKKLIPNKTAKHISRITRRIKRLFINEKNDFLSQSYSTKKFGIKTALRQSHFIVQNLEYDFLPNPSVFQECDSVHLRFIGKPISSIEDSWIKLLNKYLSDLDDRLHVGVENMKVLDWLSKKYAGQICHIPFFGIFEEFQMEKNVTEVKLGPEGNQKHMILFPGAQRSTKGLFNLSKIIESLRSNGLNASTFVQLTENSDKSDPVSNQAFSRIVENSDCFTQIVYGIPTVENYLSYISQAKIAILPYETKNYEWTGSGVLADCVKANLPMIAPRNTAIGFEIEKFNMGLVYEDLSEIPKLVSILLNETCENLKPFYNYKKRAFENLQKWLYPIKLSPASHVSVSRK